MATAPTPQRSISSHLLPCTPNPPAAAPRCCLGTAGSFGPCSQAQGLCTLTLDAPHSPKLALEYITGGKATLELLVCDGLFSSVKSLQVLKSI